VWLKKASVFIESDSLGVNRPVTIGYFTKIDPTLTHLTNFCEQLVTQLMMIDLDAETTITLASHLKQVQLEAMMNGDAFIPILPNFEVYRTWISHGHPTSQVTTDVISVKGVPKDTKLLGKFFTRMATKTSTNQRWSVSTKRHSQSHRPIHIQTSFEEQQFSLTTVATVPVNLKYDAWFVVIDANQMSETEPVSLHDHLLHQSWFIHLESVTHNKTIIVTTKHNLPAVRAWINTNLEPMIRKSMPPEIEPPPSHLLLCRLNKPVHTTTSLTYANILKKKFSLDSNSTIKDTDNNRPPHKQQAAVLNYDSDQSEEVTAAETHTSHDLQPSPPFLGPPPIVPKAPQHR